MSATPETKAETTQGMSVTQGRVKWFNNKAGYGFITVTQGDHKEEDVFVHHSAIVVAQEQYRYLVQGEYVEFDLCMVPDGDHKCQAGNVQGIDNGKLMCETRLDSRVNRMTSSDERTNTVSRPVSRDANTSEQYRVHTRGRGPREGDEWMLVRRRAPRQESNRNDSSRSNAPRFSSPSHETMRSRQNRVPFNNGGE